MKLIQFLIGALLVISPLSYAYAEGNVAAGKVKAATCAACHGEDGNSSVNPAWPKLAGQSAQYLSKELNDFKLGDKGGRTGTVMTALVANLSDQDIQDLAAYYASLPRTIDGAKPELVKAGQDLYRGGNFEKGIPACMACHGPDGLGIPPAAFPALSGQHADYVVAQLKAFRAGTRSNDLNHMMRDTSAKLSDAEMDAVASYIAGLH